MPNSNDNARANAGPTSSALSLVTAPPSGSIKDPRNVGVVLVALASALDPLTRAFTFGVGAVADPVDRALAGRWRCVGTRNRCSLSTVPGNSSASPLATIRLSLPRVASTSDLDGLSVP
jgi:hypothetical protein